MPTSYIFVNNALRRERLRVFFTYLKNERISNIHNNIDNMWRPYLEPSRMKRGRTNSELYANVHWLSLTALCQLDTS